jgi:ABC-type transport system substrate-binding protein
MVWGQQGAAVPTDIADRIRNDMGDRLDVTEYFSLGPYTINMSSQRDTWRDERVREGIYRLFQPEPFIDLVLSGRGTPVPGALPVSLEPYLVDWDDVLPSGRTIREAKRYDADESRALLEAAGFDFNATYEFSTIAGAVNETNLQVWEQQLRNHGIPNITYRVMPFGEWVDSISATGNYDFVATGHPSEDNPSRALRLNHSDTGFIHRSFNIGDPEIDELIELSETEMDRDQHLEYVKEAQRLLVDKHAHMFYVYTAENVELRHAVIQDWEFNPALQVMHRPEAWLDV